MNTVWHSEPMDVERREQFSNSNLTIPVCLLSPKIGTKGCEEKTKKWNRNTVGNAEGEKERRRG